MSRVVVVGASLAGLRAVEALRDQGFEGEITLVGAEEHAPYDRPPLSKQVLAGEWDARSIALRPEGFGALGVDLRLGVRAQRLNVEARTIELADGAVLPFDGLIIATGASPRNLPGADRFDNVYTLRTLDDALRLQSAFQPGVRVVVVGAGFIGSEVASTARKMGLDVTVVEQLALPLITSLGPVVGEALASLQRDHGVDLRLGTGVTRLEGEERLERVILDDGTAVSADVVVVGIGVVPNTGWLEGSGLAIRNGVVCDPTLMAAPGIYCAGDVARWQNPTFDEEMRVEHWTNAVEQGMAAAENLLLGTEQARPFAPVPYFWSDQFDLNINFIGRASPGDELRVIHGSLAERKFVALYRRGDRVIGGLCFGRPRLLLPFQETIARRATWSEALAQAGV